MQPPLTTSAGAAAAAAATGHAISFEELGLSEQEVVEDFFAGPAFLAWQRMGNIMAWGTSLARKGASVRVHSRHEWHADLQESWSTGACDS